MAVGYGKEDSSFWELESRIIEQINKARLEQPDNIENANDKECECGNIIPAARVKMYPRKPCVECCSVLESKSKTIDRRGLYAGMR